MTKLLLASQMREKVQMISCIEVLVENHVLASKDQELVQFWIATPGEKVAIFDANRAF